MKIEGYEEISEEEYMKLPDDEGLITISHFGE